VLINWEIERFKVDYLVRQQSVWTTIDLNQSYTDAFSTQMKSMQKELDALKDGEHLLELGKMLLEPTIDACAKSCNMLADEVLVDCKNERGKFHRKVAKIAEKTEKQQLATVASCEKMIDEVTILTRQFFTSMEEISGKFHEKVAKVAEVTEKQQLATVACGEKQVDEARQFHASMEAMMKDMRAYAESPMFRYATQVVKLMQDASGEELPCIEDLEVRVVSPEAKAAFGKPILREAVPVPVRPNSKSPTPFPWDDTELPAELRRFAALHVVDYGTDDEMYEERGYQGEIPLHCDPPRGDTPRGRRPPAYKALDVDTFYDEQRRH
jgi:hypothetical protein